MHINYLQRYITGFVCDDTSLIFCYATSSKLEKWGRIESKNVGKRINGDSLAAPRLLVL